MRRLTTVIGTAILVAAATGAAIAATADSDAPITGDALRRASQAALQETGGGRVTDTEVGDEDSYYEVEVTLPDGHSVDVQLDRQFRVVSRSADED